MSARLVVVGVLLLVGAARADDKVDAAKTQTCEKAKKFLADQKAKGKCAAEADEAAKLTCSPATYKPMNELLQKCTSAKPAASATPKCRALDADGKVIDEAEGKLATTCSTALLEKLKKKWCVAENKGKAFPYTLDFDHMNGAKKMEPTKRTWTCRSVAK
jgi:hypothetical protein